MWRVLPFPREAQESYREWNRVCLHHLTVPRTNGKKRSYFHVYLTSLLLLPTRTSLHTSQSWDCRVCVLARNMKSPDFRNIQHVSFVGRKNQFPVHNMRREWGWKHVLQTRAWHRWCLRTTFIDGLVTFVQVYLDMLKRTLKESTNIFFFLWQNWDKAASIFSVFSPLYHIAYDLKNISYTYK